MHHSYLEHTNITVSNPQATASLLCQLFDWKIRWSGKSLDQGHTVHVGTDHSYLALYTHSRLSNTTNSNHFNVGNLNHLGIVVNNLERIEDRVKQAGLSSFGHETYDPGHRFYVKIDDDLEVEVVCYAKQAQHRSLWQCASLHK